MNTTLKTGLQKSISYNSYREVVDTLAANNDTTGEDKSEARVNYTKLSARRMKRWDKTLKIDEKHKTLLADFEVPVTWLVITESWCGDAAHVMPALNKIAETNPNITLKVVLRDENEALMDMFLTNGSKSIPKLIMIDNSTEEVLATYGPRPSEATNFVNRFKAENGALTPEFKEDLQHWYNSDKGQTIVKDITQLLCKFQPSFCQ